MSTAPTPRKRPAAGALPVALLLALTLAGCGTPGFSGIEELPLPGGADVGDHPYEVTATFTDVLSLVPQSAVKVNDVAVGRVTGITLSPGDWTAEVTMLVNGDVRLPANSWARLEQTSLLGEKYVELAAPGSGSPQGRLADGATIPLSRTNRNPEVEEVFGALSMLLNGGGVNQLKTITTELGKALDGNEPEVRDMLRRVDTLVTDLDARRGDITRALDGVDRLSSTLATRKREVGVILDDLSPGLKVLEQQRGSLMTMLRSLDTLSETAVGLVDRSKDDMVADLEALAPALRALADAGRDLPDSLEAMLTYPFTDEVLRGVRGDYLNVYLDVTAQPGTRIIPPLDPDAGPAAQGGHRPAPLPLPPVTPPTTATGGEG
ncbi:MAG TPA: virulence factor Mce family protein Precursor [Streptomyces sp.]|nr:virulence factor Mce family protein Precursor [Streptomyces sp.]